jgi:hypothetical protein
MNYCFHPAHTCAATQEGRDSARVGIDTFTAAVRVFAGIALLTGILAAQERVNAAGVRSQFNIAWDANYIYVCVAPNTWRRSALAAW